MIAARRLGPLTVDAAHQEARLDHLPRLPRLANLELHVEGVSYEPCGTRVLE